MKKLIVIWLLVAHFFGWGQHAIQQAEYFWGAADPGQGSATSISATDGSFNEVVETLIKTSATPPSTNGVTRFNIRVKDLNGNWGPVFKRVVYLQEATRDLKITSAEFFWDTDPGQGSGTTLLVFDGNFNESLESLLATNISIPSTFGVHSMNIRVKDEINNWGPVFKRAVYLQELIRNIKITSAEFFWDTDPGEGSATALLAFDGNFNSAIELLSKTNVTMPTSGGLHSMNIRVQDESGNWGPIYKRVVYSSEDPRDLKITAGEFFWGNDPGEGSGTVILAFDGNFNEAIEALSASGVSIPSNAGLQAFGIRVKDEAGEWGPVFKRAIYLQGAIRDLKITAGEFFWGVTDPGEGSGTALIAFDGAFDESVETVLKTAITTPSSGGIQLFNIRLSDEEGNWGPLYKRAIYTPSPLRDPKIVEAEMFWGTSDPGFGNGYAMNVVDGNFDEVLEDLLRYSPPNSGYGLALMNVRVKDESGYWGPLYKRAIDNNLNNSPNCLSPSNILVNNISSNSAIINWTVGGSHNVNATSTSNPVLSLKGVLDLHGSGNPVYSGTDGKAIHLIATDNIADLSVYSLDVISNGNGSLNSSEYILTGSANAGDDILIYRVGSGDSSANFFSDYFATCYSNFELIIPSGTSFPSGNGDDPVALFFNNQLIDSLTFLGNPILSGPFNGDPYNDSWAHRDSNGTWQFGGKDCDIDGTYNVDSSSCPYPICGAAPTVYNFEYGPAGYTQGSGISSVVNASSTIATNPNSLFVGGTNATWSYIHNLVITTDGAPSQLAQTYTINVTSLPATGAKARLIKSNATGNAVFDPAAVGQDLVLGPNTFTASAVTFDRYVRIQFNNNLFEFDAITVNGTSVYNGYSTSLFGLTANTTYDVYVQADCGFGDVSVWAGPFSFTTPCGIAVAPYIENFNGTSFPDCWTQETTDDWDWTLDAFGTPSFNTGPSDDITGGGNYIFIETSSGTLGNTFELITPTIDLSALTSPQLRFYSHMYGSAIGTLNVDISNDNGATYTNIFTKSGGQGNQWNEETVDLSNYSGFIHFKITAIKAGNFYGDIAIDNFEVREGPCSVYSTTETVLACDSYTWSASGQTYVLSGIKTEILQSVNGCDSTVNLDLTINNSSSSTESPVTACDSLVWNGSTYFTSGNQTFTTTNAVGCDSVVTLQLTVNNSSSSFLATSSCISYIWNGTTYNTSGVYENISVNSSGCTQTDTLDLTITTSSTSLTQSSCDLFSWNGTDYTTSGTYYSASGTCVDTLYLTVNSSTSSVSNLTSCDSLEWNGFTYFTSGNQTFTTTNAAGCDSIANLVLTVNNSSSSLLATSSCNSYDWNGITYSSSGVYTQNLINSVGCTQTDTLDLTIDTTSTSLTQSSCDLFSWNGTEYTTSGTYYNPSGTCVDTLFLTVNSSTSSVSNLVSCDSLEWNGFTYFTSGNQTFTTTNAAGCDSIVNLVLTVNNSSSSLLATSSCNSYNWNGTTYSSSGVYENISVNSSGCTQTDTLDLTITTSSTSLTQSSCDSFSWNGTDYTTSGTYYRTSGTCVDSLYLTVNSSTSSVTDLVSCNSIEWNGLNYLTSGTYTYTTTNSAGCDSTATLNLTINISVSAGADQTVCEGDNFQLSASFLQGANYSWSPTTGLSNPFVRSPNGYLNSSTTYTVTCSLNGCSDNSQVTITVQPSPNINLSSNQTICLGDQVILDAIGANNISWNNGVSNTVPFYPIQSSYYTVSGDNSYGCVSEDSVLVKVNPLPNVNAGQDINVCTDSAAILTASGANNYVWNNNVINGQSFVPLGSSNYIVIGIDNNGCENSDTVKLTINPLPNVNAGSDQTVCLGDDVTLSASGANSYSWTNGVVNNVAFVPTSPHPDFISSIDYSVTGTSNYGCTNTDIVKVIINPLPDIYAYSFINGVIDSSEAYLCSGDSIRLYGDGAGTGTYEWDNGVIDNEWFTPTNSNIYTLTGTRDFTGCSNTDQITLNVNELPEVVETIINEEFGDDGSISIDVIAGIPPFDFDWDVDGLGDNDDFQDLTDLRGGTYVLIVTDDNGCKSRFTIVLENMNSLIIIPSALTPNGDGVNDVWDIKGLNDYPEMQLQVFDRNGILLHEQKGLYTAWDGIYAGKQLPEGDYFYIIDLKNGEQPNMGAVSIKF